MSHDLLPLPFKQTSAAISVTCLSWDLTKLTSDQFAVAALILEALPVRTFRQCLEKGD